MMSVAPLTESEEPSTDDSVHDEAEAEPTVEAESVIEQEAAPTSILESATEPVMEVTEPSSVIVEPTAEPAAVAEVAAVAEPAAVAPVAPVAPVAVTPILSEHILTAKKVKSFKELQLDDRLVKAIAKQRWPKPTLVQSATVPLVKEGRDVIAKSSTGSGSYYIIQLRKA